MALSTFVKINGVSNLSDARYCAGMFVDIIGFELEETSTNFISPTQFSEITGWVSGVEFVGEFNDYDDQQILETIENYPTVKWVEHHRIQPLQNLEGKGLGLIYKMDLDEVKNIEVEVAEKLHSTGIIFHITSDSDELSEVDLESISKISQNCKVILGVGIDATNVKQRIADLNLYGISLTGGTEIKPGLKDFDELADILEVLEED